MFFFASAVKIEYRRTCENSLIFHLMPKLEVIFSVPLTRVHQHKGTDCAWPPPQPATVGAAAAVLKMNETLNLHGTQFSAASELEQISPLQLRQFGVQFSLARQKGWGLLGTEPQPALQSKCRQVLIDPCQRIWGGLLIACNTPEVARPNICKCSVTGRSAQQSGTNENQGGQNEDFSPFFANITSWSKAARSFVLERPVQCLLIA